MPRRTRNAPATRSAVARAAERLFARRGYDGTSMRDVAAASGVAQPLIQYHFGSKRRLWEAVKAKVMDRYRAFELPDLEDARTFHAELTAFMQSLVRKMIGDPHLLRLSSWTRLQDKPGLWPGEREAMQRTSRILRAAQRRGLLNRALDPMLLAAMLIALALYWCEERLRLASLFPGKRIPDRKYIRQMVTVFLRGAASRSAP